MFKYKQYVCATCSQDFTRNSSAKRHNDNIHHGMGIIVRFFDYIVGRLEGRYVASDPLLFRKNNGSKFSRAGPNFAAPKYKASQVSYGDSIMERGVDLMPAIQRFPKQATDARHDFAEWDYIINLIFRVLQVTKMLSIQQSPPSTPVLLAPLNNNSYGIEITTLLAQQFDIDYFFGFRGEVCPWCTYYAIYRLDFRGGSIHNRIWSNNHKCDPKASAISEIESQGIRYTRACDSIPFYCIPIVERWLKDGLNIFAIKLPDLFDMQKGLIEVTHPRDPSKAIGIPMYKDEIITRTTDNRKYWVARAVANENRPTPISQEELLNFLITVKNSTFGVFNICSRALLGGRSEYYLIYLGKAAAAAQVHTDI